MPDGNKKAKGVEAQRKRMRRVRFELSFEMAQQLSMMCECIEMWGVNSRGCLKLWEENKELIEELQDQLYIIK